MNGASPDAATVSPRRVLPGPPSRVVEVGATQLRTWHESHKQVVALEAVKCASLPAKEQVGSASGGPPRTTNYAVARVQVALPQQTCTQLDGVDAVTIVCHAATP